MSRSPAACSSFCRTRSALKGIDMMPPTVDLGRQIPVPPPGIQHVVPALGGEWHVQLRYGQTTVNDQPPVHGLTTRRGARGCLLDDQPMAPTRRAERVPAAAQVVSR